MLYINKFIYLLPFLFFVSHSYKILVYNPRRSHSHIQYVGRIADTLQEAGHSVTVLQPIQIASIETIGSKLAKVISINNPIGDDDFMKILKLFEDDVWRKNGNNPLSMVSLFKKFSILLKQNCKDLIENTTLINEFKKENFDIAFSQFYNPCAFGLFEMMGIKKVISGSSTGLNEAYYDLFGLEYPLSYVPSIIGGGGIPKGIIERTKNVFSYLFSKYFIIKSFNSKDQDAFDEVFGEGKYNLWKLMSKSAFHFVNSNPLIDFPHPTTSKIVDIAGIGIVEGKSLDDEYDKILNIREKNVIMSFGSVVKSKNIPDDKKKSILETFKQFPNVTFIWKYEDNDISFAKDYPNVILKKWIPQVDLLKDKRVNLFITHGGLNSAIELSYNGVPSIFIPFFTDQKRNSFMIKRYECSIIMEKETLGDPVTFKKNINEILNNKKYLENAKKLAKMLSLYPHEAKKKLIKSVEFAAEFGDIKEMNLPSMEMNIIELYNIDVYFILSLIVIISITIAYKVGKKIIMLCRKKIIKNKVD
ncbi:UDP-glucuronosyl/UDP-glucosyltransferase family-containing protein [Strongyloides ratti]|uniref:glucuronosyltransferase n=1 Tax=Strongyloides ratti TaxID=34506 RepID=A0A090LJG5_STRRB|nr:UDP-glucuronosyl/UDP-glucosyltransferase family-containing protein [Strongyloides ratti]CEF69977.1 UDP-glucuronosyl/UDP-glucosyltransferase family-containing protein [Strongyloides ratti]